MVDQPAATVEALKSEYPDLILDLAGSTSEAIEVFGGNTYTVVLFRFQKSDPDLQKFVTIFSSCAPKWCCSLAEDESVDLRQELSVEFTRLFRHPAEPAQVVRQLHRLLQLQAPRMRLFNPAQPSKEQRQSEIHETFLRVNRARVADLLLYLERGSVEEHRADFLREAHRLAGTLGTFGYTQGTEPAQRMESLLKKNLPLTAGDLAALKKETLFLQALLKADSATSIVPQEQSLPLVACFTPDDTLRLEMVARAGDFRFRLETPPVAEIISLCDSRPFDLVIVDFGSQIGELPANLLRSLNNLTCPVVAVCKDPTMKHRLTLVEWGVDMVMLGPVSGRELAETAAGYLQAPAGARVMILDDDPLFVAALQASLQPLNVSLFTVSDPARLWESIQARSPDLLLLDYGLPSINGLQICRAMKACPAQRDLPVAFVSASTDAAVELEAWRSGAVGFIAKSMERRDLAQRVLEVVRKVRETSGTTIDPLTGLSNRAPASKAIKSFLGLGSRRGLSVSLAIIDLDHFKSINDRYGHPTGDSVLKTVAGVLKSTLRNEDVVARWGGEEFVVAMFLFDKRQAKERLETALKRVKQQVHTTEDGQSFQVSFSAGVAQYPIDGTDLAHLYEKADQALYAAKSRGRSQVAIAADVQSYSKPVDVVLVEDDHPLGTAVLGELEEKGLSCVWFQTAEELAQAMLGEAPYLKSKVLVVDKGLGLTDGLSIVREFRQSTRHQDTKVITCSSQMSDEEIEGAYKLGVFEHISKPFAIPVLYRTIKRALER